MGKDFKITFLGTSAASVSLRTATSACLIEVGQTRVMVDAGIGALRQLGKAGLTPDTLDAVLLTHWHFDHFAGLPALATSKKGSRPLPIFGPEPPGLLHLCMRAVYPAVIRQFHNVEVHDSIHFTDLSAESFSASHRIPTLGWILSENPPGKRRVVISGDTQPDETVIRSAEGADLLVYEATYLEKHHDRAVKSRHSTVLDAANVAAKSGVKILALTHISPRYKLDAICSEYAKTFPGAIVPQPLTSISI